MTQSNDYQRGYRAGRKEDHTTELRDTITRLQETARNRIFEATLQTLVANDGGNWKFGDVPITTPTDFANIAMRIARAAVKEMSQ